MQLRILGCSGGISPGNGTTAFLLDNDVLIDAGTGVETLNHYEMFHIKHLVVTHGHLDHVCHLPFLLNNLISEKGHSIDVYGLPETIQALKDHVFNNVIWPDFTVLPNADRPVVRLHTFDAGDTLSLCEKQITVLPAEHTVPAVGFHVVKGDSNFAFSGDCSANDVFWEALNRLPPVGMLIMDDQYLEAEKAISEAAKHYYPASLKQDLQKLNYKPQLFLTHLPPYKKQTVLDEAIKVLSDWSPKALEPNQTFQL